jgi:hypothetical protein
MASGVAEKAVLAKPSLRPTDAREVGAEPNAAQRFPHRRPDRKFHLVWLCLAGGVVLLSMVMQIRSSQEVNVPFTQIPLPELCSFRRMTGMDCAGCGMTRCFISLGHGDLPGAWTYNPAGILLYAIVLFQLPFRSWQLWRIRRGQPEIQVGRFGYGVMIAFAVLMVAQWGIKQAALFF